jgi:hypothetical protein
MAIRIFVDGPDAAELEEVARRALGYRPEGETWLVSLVKHRVMWGVTVLVSPQDRLRDWSYTGPRELIGRALTEAVKQAGFAELERRMRNLPHAPERRRTAVGPDAPPR